MTASKKKRNSRPMPHRELSGEEEQAILREIKLSNDRACAIAAGGFVENALARAIMSRLRLLSDTQQRELFEFDGALLGTFYAKIQLGFVLALYSERTQADLKLVKNIRNLFAHRLEMSTFAHPEITGAAGRLLLPKWRATIRRRAEETNPRVRFEETAAFYAAKLDALAYVAKRPSPPHSTFEAWRLPSPDKSALQTPLPNHNPS